MTLIFLFYVFAFLTFIFSLFLVFHPKTIPASLGMTGSMVFIGLLYSLLHFPFFTFIQIILYAGAVMVMIIFLIMSQGYEEDGKEVPLPQTITAFIVAIFFLFSFSRVVSKSFLPVWYKVEKDFGSIKEIGRTLVKNYGVPFEIASFLLVAAMVGSVILAKRSLK